jgi:inosose dehydratase
VHLKGIRREVLEEVRRDGLSFLDAVLRGVFTVPGDGDTEFAAEFEALEVAGYEGWYVVEAEQDPEVANPLEYAKIARGYIRETAGI